MYQLIVGKLDGFDGKLGRKICNRENFLIGSFPDGKFGRVIFLPGKGNLVAGQ